MQIQLKGLFAIDTLSLILFAMALLGLIGHLPPAANVAIQTLYVGITLLLTVSFIRRRNIPMVILKLSMLFILYLLNATAFFLL